MECGAKEVDGFSCYELFGFPLSGNIVIQRYMLYILACFMLYAKHPSNFTEEGYRLLADLFTDAYDHDWDTAYILKENRESNQGR